MEIRRQRDKVKTISDILAAAKVLFSEKGFHGTSIRDIETVSGVSKGLILHHFGSKESLYAALQDHLTQEYTAWMAAQRPVGNSLKELIAATICNAFTFFKENHAYRRISLWSYLEGHERVTELEKRFTTALIQSMRAGQKANLVREDIDPFLMPFIIKGTIEYWFQKELLIQELAPGEPDDQASGERLVEALAKLFLK